MAKFNFNLREPGSDKETAIHLVIRWNKNRLVFPTKESILSKFWETDKEKRNFQRAKETKQFPEYPEFNARLDNIESTAKTIFRQFVNDNNSRLPYIEEYKVLLSKEFNKSDNSEKRDLFSFIEKVLNERLSRVNDKTGKQIASSTINAHQRTYDLLIDFSQEKRTRIDFDTIDLDFYHNFTEYISKEKKFSNNTIGKHIKNIKTILNEATERGYNTHTAYKSKRFKVLTETIDAIYLTEDELNELNNLDLANNPRLDRVRDLFLVGCWTGLRFSDFSTIQPENIKRDMLEIKTQKTGESVAIPIHPIVKKIMAKYKGKYPNSLPPSISNPKMNKYLKDLGQMDIESLKDNISKTFTKGGVNVTKKIMKYELLTTHTARRSFATNLYLDGVSPILIMKITGHKTERVFLKYIRVTPNENAKLLQLHWQNKQTLKAV